MNNKNVLMTNSAQSFFSGVASDYSAFRHTYPTVILDKIVSEFLYTEHPVLLDLGCGPGILTMQLSPYVRLGIGVDIDPHMVNVAVQEAQRRNCTNLNFFVCPAESAPETEGGYQLITLGTSFHWMDRLKVAAHARNLLHSNGGIAIITIFSLQSGTEGWQEVIYRLVERHTGVSIRPEARADGKIKSHEEILLTAGFLKPQKFIYKAKFSYSIESLTGFLRSTSFASPARLGEKTEAFYKELINELQIMNDEAMYTELITYEMVYACCL